MTVMLRFLKELEKHCKPVVDITVHTKPLSDLFIGTCEVSLVCERMFL